MVENCKMKYRMFFLLVGNICLPVNHDLTQIYKAKHKLAITPTMATQSNKYALEVAFSMMISARNSAKKTRICEK